MYLCYQFYYAGCIVWIMISDISVKLDHSEKLK